MEGASQVDIDNGFEVVVAHLLQRRPANIPGILNEDVDAAVAVQGRVDDRLAAICGGDRFRAGLGRTAGRGDLAHHLLGRPRVGAVPGDAAAGIVDDDLRALRRKQQGVRAAQSPSASGDDGDEAVESQVRHAGPRHRQWTSCPSPATLSRRGGHKGSTRWVLPLHTQ